MKQVFTAVLAAAAFLLAAAPVALAQNSGAAGYARACFPGGPDSLRALVYRNTQVGPPGLPTGLAVVQFELMEGREPGNFKLLGPDQPKKSALGKAVPAALAQLQARMPAWQPAPETKPEKKATVLLALRFGAAKEAQTYPYADKEPLFSYLPNLPSDHSSAAPINFAQATYRELATYIQRNVRYPADAMRNQQEGRVDIYFEVAESGAIENAEIVSSAGSFLDAEVLKVVKRLPDATKPALLQGRPVRIYYVMPVTFKMQ